MRRALPITAELAEELSKAKYVVKNDGKGSIDILAKTPGIGNFNLTFLLDSATGNYYTDRFNYDSPIGSVVVYDYSGAAKMPSGPIHLDWKLITEKDRFYLSLSHASLGRVKLYLKNDIAGNTELKRAAVFDILGKGLFTYRA